MRNKHEFDSSAASLQQYELRLIRQMKVIETIEGSAANVRHQFQQNVRSLTEVQAHQDCVIDELNAIENELDSILPQY